SRHGLSCSRHLSRSQAEIPLILAVQISRASSLDKIGLIKFYEWEYEAEYRHLIDLKDPDLVSGLYFEPFSTDMRLKEIYVGSRCEVNMRNLQKLRDNIDPDIALYRTRPSNLYFKVIKDLSKGALRTRP
ncbi:hypothetical protein, partial [Rhizobium sp. BK379]|uniref:hypothetical protein n=1 Tax=Rhizobium sp. BK379 TaxID=2587059 RepID=UPI00182CEB26